ncbi:MAG: type III PLP-dependent enzyme [Proteobacteria bacterium]|nr:type III PLP-dependent enzyme [Pseudomonadota bacterium]
MKQYIARTQTAFGATQQQPTFSSAHALAAAWRPDLPVHLLYADRLYTNAAKFLDNFNGEVLYAVKCNPDATVLRHLYTAGVRHFDVASITEVRTIASLFPDATMAFMHPVKNRAAIREAYFTHGVRTFVLDSYEELLKILEETNAARDLTLVVRLAMPKGAAVMSLSGKFGIVPAEAVRLLKKTRKGCVRLGLSFHVGSQTMDPQAYVNAINTAADVVMQAGVRLDVLDVGGGFPAAYPGMVPPPLGMFMDAIHTAVAARKVFAQTKLWCEPGRALVADAGSVLVRVELRKGDHLYLNDGVYGSLFDAGSTADWRYPVRIIRPDGDASGVLAPFSFYGPTCDSLDHMKGPFYLPSDIQEGDWIEIGQLGAYGATMQTMFNGFHSNLLVHVTQLPSWPLANQTPQMETLS